MHLRVFSSLPGLHSQHQEQEPLLLLSDNSVSPDIAACWLAGHSSHNEGSEDAVQLLPDHMALDTHSVPTLPYKHFEVPSLTPISEPESHPFMLVAPLYSFRQVKALEHYMCSEGQSSKDPTSQSLGDTLGIS